MSIVSEEIREIFKILGIKVTTEPELFNVLIHRDDLLRVDIEQKLTSIINKLKEKYKSSKLNCLHENRESKQKFPGINLVRQILKCNGYHLKPLVFSKGYSKHNGKKLVERNFKVIRLENYADIKQEQQIIESNQETKPIKTGGGDSITEKNKETLSMYQSLVYQNQKEENTKSFQANKEIIELNF
jgi:hypothetical protein